jgi:hypothetical protein
VVSNTLYNFFEGENIMYNGYENYPKLGSGTKWYSKLNEYVTESGLTFDYTKEPNISDFLKFVNQDVSFMGECVLNNEENRNGSTREIINGKDFDGSLVHYKGIHPSWNETANGWIYCITYDKHIVKVGMTIQSLAGRYTSYSAGRRRLMAQETSTPSTTNFVVNEVNYAALLGGTKIEIYGIRCGKMTMELEKYGLIREIRLETARAEEEMITDRFVEYTGHIPVLCKQKGNSTK